MDCSTYPGTARRRENYPFVARAGNSTRYNEGETQINIFPCCCVISIYFSRSHGSGILLPLTSTMIVGATFGPPWTDLDGLGLTSSRSSGPANRFPHYLHRSTRAVPALFIPFLIQSSDPQCAHTTVLTSILYSPSQ